MLPPADSAARPVMNIRRSILFGFIAHMPLSLRIRIWSGPDSPGVCAVCPNHHVTQGSPVLLSSENASSRRLDHAAAPPGNVFETHRLPPRATTAGVLARSGARHPTQWPALWHPGFQKHYLE